VHPAAMLTLLNWIFVHNNFSPALVHFVPLTVLEAYRTKKTTSLRKDNRRDPRSRGHNLPYPEE